MTGEGMVFGIGRGCAEEYLKARGFEHIVDMDGDALDKAYFSGRGQKLGVVARA